MNASAASRFPNWLLASIIAVWFVGISVPLMVKMGGHYAALPGPTVSARPGSTNPWEAIHILSAECGCSGVVADYLASRRTATGLNETVWVLDGQAEWEPALIAAGFQVEHRDAESLALTEGIQGVPWLLLRQSAGQATYSGGYSSSPPRPGGEFQDIALWRKLAGGSSDLTPLPAYGCATSQKLKGLTDPFSLKQTRTTSDEQPR